MNLLQHSLYFQIIRERLPDYPTRNSFIWNTSPGALLTLPNFADSSRYFVIHFFRNRLNKYCIFQRFTPFLLDSMGEVPQQNYTAVVYVQIGAQLTPNSALYKLVKSITKSQFVDRVSRVSYVSSSSNNQLTISFQTIRY